MKKILIATLMIVTLAPISNAHGDEHNKQSHEIDVTVFADGLKQPWGMTFLPDGRLLVTEKAGHLRIIDTNGQVSVPIEGVPAVNTKGQGGLLDVVLDPNFIENKTIYFSYALLEQDDNESRTAVAKAQLHNDTLSHVKPIWQQAHSKKAGYHYGSRLVFDRTGHLFVTLGDRNYGKDEVQDLSTHFGKVVRIDTDGKPAANNPFLNQSNALPDIYSYGHRNIQGAFLHPETGELWANEHGPRGGDEINVIKAGHNYGWPVITYGINYNGTPITDKRFMEGMEQPIHYWDPSIATSGMLIYNGKAFPNWQGDIFTGALKLMHLNRIKLNDQHQVLTEERLLKAQKQRIRAIEQGPDGFIYVATDNSAGQILKITPAQ
ncbi:PQQ-dependent sugar dehydrogenase [Marinicella litoralis]|uniref:Glucose/arabinose dehydrogenase n=1 Tax=Marinicella litoralis TaxID=644220 RepID=A0A4R6XV39_9GAMM|nr:PQQ-dependent sugar dehydrogenase [Marinicella litoralis]TDR22399.1 glucose/arabinose dehydrogenase [Marinicella litoralis]